MTIVTTNHVEQLDAALVRSGRLDRTFHLGHIAAPELERLYAWFYETETPADAPANTINAGLSPAEIAEQFKQHLDDPAAGWDAVLGLISSPTHTTLEAVAA